MAQGEIEYKGQKAKILMMGTKQEVPDWRGELFVAMIQYGSKDEENYDVVPDSTDTADLDDLPEVKTFQSYNQAVQHFLKLENNKEKWK